MVFIGNIHGLFVYYSYYVFKFFWKKSKRKSNTLRVDNSIEFYKRSIKCFLQNYDIEMYSTLNDGKSAIAERFIKTLKNKIYRYMTSVSKNVYIDKLVDIVTKYIINTKIHIIAQLKWNIAHVKSSTYIDFIKENKKKALYLKLVTLLEYQNIKIFLQSVTLQTDLEKFLKIRCRKLLIILLKMLLMTLMAKKLTEYFTRKNCKNKSKIV